MIEYFQLGNPIFLHGYVFGMFAGVIAYGIGSFLGRR